MWKKKFQKRLFEEFSGFSNVLGVLDHENSTKNNLKKVKTPEKPDDFANFDYFFQKFTWSLVKFEEAKKSGWGLKK